jgi:hypothetical protein
MQMPASILNKPEPLGNLCKQGITLGVRRWPNVTREIR